MSAPIVNISQENPALVTCPDENRHGFETGDHVQFVEVKGMTEINDREPLPIKVTGPYTFAVEVDATKFGAYDGPGGTVSQVKVPVKLSFKSYDDALNDPEHMISDFAKMERMNQLHLAFQAIHQYEKEKGELPKPYNRADAEEFLGMVKALNDSASDMVKTEIDPALIKVFSYTSRGTLPAMCSVLGSFVGQEIMKACSGKFNPLRQFLYFDALETLPDDPEVIAESAAAPVSSSFI
jgi:ubiquitin-activating enzyme E1